MKYFYYNNCVNWDDNDIDGLSDMVDNSIDITRSTFVSHVDKDALAVLEKGLGYERFKRRGLTMANDWAVSYYRGKLHGTTVYFFRQSAIEYVFLPSPTSEEIIQNRY